MKKETSLGYGERRREILEWKAKGKTKKEVIELMHGRCSERRVSQVWDELEEPKPTQDPLDLPALDRAKPLGPQCEAAAVAVLFDAVKNGSKAQRIQASKELLRIAQRDKAPPPTSRKFKIVLSEIDYKDDGDIHIISRQPIEVRL